MYGVDWEIIGGDLNDEAGGDFIYLCVARDPGSAPTDPISNVRTYNDNDKDYFYPYQHELNTSYGMVNQKINGHWSSEHCDLNNGCSGSDYIYLHWFKREMVK